MEGGRQGQFLRVRALLLSRHEAFRCVVEGIPSPSALSHRCNPIIRDRRPFVGPYTLESSYFAGTKNIGFYFTDHDKGGTHPKRKR